ncbi:hypothetical protein DESC_970041 [Desulfosarcina cetonica]|nr:hypothetical protein DESC_970041 [Desulfosarcina cetonica]
MTLKGDALFAMQPAVPILKAVPGADDQIFSGAVQAAKGSSGDVSGLDGGQGAHLDDQRRQFGGFFRIGEGALDHDGNGHVDLLRWDG